MFKLVGLKWKKEFEQLKALHDIEIQKRDAKLHLLEQELTQKLRLKEEELVKKHDISLTEATALLKLEYQQKLKQQELNFQKEINELKASISLNQAKWRQELQDENYSRLKDSLTKLHEEGNITTKFTHDLALKMLEKVPTAKSEHKYITGDVSVDTK